MQLLGWIHWIFMWNRWTDSSLKKSIYLENVWGQEKTKLILYIISGLIICIKPISKIIKSIFENRESNILYSYCIFFSDEKSVCLKTFDTHDRLVAFCWTDIDDCVNNSCQNNATCVDHVSGYTCNCPAGFTGTYCEISM